MVELGLRWDRTWKQALLQLVSIALRLNSQNYRPIDQIERAQYSKASKCKNARLKPFS